MRPLRTTTYTVKAFNGIEEVTDKVVVYVDNCDYQEDESKNSVVKMTAYPNPSAGQVLLNVSGAKENLTMTIFDFNGRVMHQEEVNPGFGSYEQQLDLSRFPKGVYLIKLHNSQINETTKVLLI